MPHHAEDWTAYPFTVPAIRSLQELTFTSRVCCFTGENGSGKSTLLEGIAAHYGFGPEGGTRNFHNSSTASKFSSFHTSYHNQPSGPDHPSFRQPRGASTPPHSLS